MKPSTTPFAAEDPFIWRGPGRYWVVVKDFKGHFTGKGTPRALFESSDGMEWKLAAHPLASTLDLTWADDRVEPLSKLERPLPLLVNGESAVLLSAAAHAGKLEESFNVQIPLGKDP